MTIHFISGLPRSGSTLLAAILRQNARLFSTGMTSPMASLYQALEGAMARRNEAAVFVSDVQRATLLRGLFSSYYAEYWISRTVIDTSRTWCGKLPALATLFPDCRIIACVRDVGWIMDSFERLHVANPLQPSAIHGFDVGSNVYSRSIDDLAHGGGIVGWALNALREACSGSEKHRLLLVEYEDLCRYPAKTISAVYEHLQEPLFAHDFHNVEHSGGEFDRQIGAPGLHDVRGAVEWRPRETLLPPDLFHRYDNDQFWRTS